MQSELNLKKILKMIKKQQQINKSLLDRESYFQEELQMVVSDKFYYSDFKNFRKVELFKVRKYNQNNYLITQFSHHHNQLLELYILYFIINSGGKQQNLTKFKKYAYKAEITLPLNYPTSVLQWDIQDSSFYRQFIAKILKSQINFEQIQSIIDLFHNYEIFTKIVVIIFRNYLKSIQAIPHDYNISITNEHIILLNDHFGLTQHPFIFDITERALINENLPNIKGLIIQKPNIYLKEKQENQVAKSQIFENQTYKKSIKKVQSLEDSQQNKSEQIYNNTDKKRLQEVREAKQQQHLQRQQQKQEECQESYRERVLIAVNPEEKEQFQEVHQNLEENRSFSSNTKRKLQKDMNKVRRQVGQYRTVPNIQNQRIQEKQQMKKLLQKGNRSMLIVSEPLNKPIEKQNHYDLPTCKACQLI